MSREYISLDNGRGGGDDTQLRMWDIGAKKNRDVGNKGQKIRDVGNQKNCGMWDMGFHIYRYT